MASRVGLLLCVLSLLIACAGKKRDFAESTALLPNEGVGGGSSSDASTEGTAGSALSNGTECRSAIECASGSCVDGVCCDTPCEVVCAACNSPGREGQCSAISNDVACAAACPDSTECRTYGSSAGTANCEAAGTCREVTECAPSDLPLGTPCRDGAGTCDGIGECVVLGEDDRAGVASTFDHGAQEGGHGDATLRVYRVQGTALKQML